MADATINPAPERNESLWRSSPASDETFGADLSAEAKVAGLSTFWSEARLNFVFFDRIPGIDWNKLFVSYISRVLASHSTGDYYRVMMEFAAQLHDGHTNVYPPAQLHDEFYASPGLRTELIEGRVIVTAVRDPLLKKAGWIVGDEIKTVNDQPVARYAEEQVLPFISASTKQDLHVRVFGYFLLSGPASEALRVGIETADGRTVTRPLRRRSSELQKLAPLPAAPLAEFSMRTDGVAVLAVNEFQDDAGVQTLRSHRAELAHSRGLIIDIRENGGGQTENGFAILQILALKPFYSALSRTRLYDADLRSHGGTPGYRIIEPTRFDIDPSWHLDLPVVTLVGPRTYSAAEDFAVAFDSMARGLLVGEATGGSTGNPLTFDLPGGGSARICAKDDRYPDGRAFEGVGVIPQVTVHRTVLDVRAGTDPALDEAARRLLKRS